MGGWWAFIMIRYFVLWTLGKQTQIWVGGLYHHQIFCILYNLDWDMVGWWAFNNVYTSWILYYFPVSMNLCKIMRWSGPTWKPRWDSWSQGSPLFQSPKRGYNTKPQRNQKKIEDQTFKIYSRCKKRPVVGESLQKYRKQNEGGYQAFKYIQEVRRSQ